MNRLFPLLAMLLLSPAACDEVSIWPTDPLGLQEAILRDDHRLVIEWIQAGADLDRPRPVEGLTDAAGQPAAQGGAMRPLDFAIALDRWRIALILTRAGAVVGQARSGLNCLVAANGSLTDMAWLVEHGHRDPPETTCPAKRRTLLELAQGNSAEMAAMLTAPRASSEAGDDR